MPAGIRDLQDLGVSLFAGEAERRLETVLRDALEGTMKPLYDHMDDLPELGGTVTPFLPRAVVRRYMAHLTSFDAGRGCPFKCSFCTIINVQGRTSRWREADDVERIVRANLAQGITGSSSPTTTSRATRTGSRSSTASSRCARAASTSA